MITRGAITRVADHDGVNAPVVERDSCRAEYPRRGRASAPSTRALRRRTPHTLRHVFASELLRADANLRQVQELLGHKHLDSTHRYARVTAHELRGAVKRLRWVGWRVAAHGCQRLRFSRQWARKRASVRNFVLCLDKLLSQMKRTRLK